MFGWFRREKREPLVLGMTTAQIAELKRYFYAVEGLDPSEISPWGLHKMTERRTYREDGTPFDLTAFDVEFQMSISATDIIQTTPIPARD
jgi:hypothetical protein